MAEITKTVVVASTHLVSKYGGLRMAPGALEQMAVALNTGQIPMQFNHDPLRPLPADLVRAVVRELADGESVLEVTFRIEERLWGSVEEEFAQEGAPGGFSFAAGSPQLDAIAGAEPELAVAMDAAGFSDAERAAVHSQLSAQTASSVSRLLQFGARDELVRIIVEHREIAEGVGLNLAASALWDALKLMLGGVRRAETSIEWHDRAPDGTDRKAVIRSSDPSVIEAALKKLDEPRGSLTVYEPDTRAWRPPGGPENPLG